jgi:hypothetical protein
VAYYSAERVVLKMGAEEGEDEDSGEERRREKKIKKKPRTGSTLVKRENNESPMRSFEGHDHSDIDRYLSTEVVRRGRVHKL